jgi:hypothetical protein
MSLQLPDYVHGYATAPAPAAYGYIVTETATFSDMSGSFTVDVWQDADSYNAGKTRIDTIGLRLGSIVREAAGETPAVRLATLEELLAEEAFGAVFRSTGSTWRRHSTRRTGSSSPITRCSGGSA